MKLGGRIALIASIALAVVIAIAGLISGQLMMQQFHRLEEDTARSRALAARDASDFLIDEMDKIARDWGEYDELYDFLNHTRTQFTAEALTNVHHLDQAMFIDSSGRLLMQLFSARTHEPLLTPAHLARRIPPHDVKPHTGLMLCGDTLLLVSIQPVTNAARSAPPSGAMVIARRVDELSMQKLSRFIGAPVRISPVGNSRGETAQLGVVQIAHLSSEFTTATTTIPGMEGAPVGTITITLPRSISTAGQQMVHTLGLFGLAPLLCVAAIAGFLFVRVTQQKVSLARSASLLKATLDSSADGIIVMNATGQVVLTNELFWRMWKIDAAACSVPALLKQAMLDQVSNPAAFLSGVDRAREDEESVLRDLIELRDDRVLERVSQPQKIGDQIVGRIWAFHDVTAEMRSEQQLMRAAMFDMLTGLPNRAHLVSRLGLMIHDPRYAVALINIDRFKNINDTLGHASGDAVICGAAQRLREVADRLKANGVSEPVLSRVGADEFALLIQTERSTEVAIDTARYIQQAFAQAFEVSGQQLFASVSIGLAVADVTHSDPMQVLRDADTALYRAKSGGKGKFTLFHQSMRQSVANYFQIENELRIAIEKQQLEVWYQPLVSLSTGRLIGLEALVRWRHPEKGIINPGDFIPIAEDTGLVIPIGVCVLDQAAKQIVEWNRGIRAGDPLFVSINLSRRHLVGDDVLLLVRRAIRDLGADPSWLKLEVTESMVMDDLHQSIQLLSELRKMKVPIHMDDFGTGHSSLATLKALPVDGIKIDRAFVSTIRDGHRPDILNAVMTLGRGMGMEIVAEGIETTEQLAVLVSLQCDIGQGYLFGRPVTAGATETLIRAEMRSARQGCCYWNVIHPDPSKLPPAVKAG